ncbi:MAG: MXAN_5187 C-terminal domain-containing protein, partial [Polyangiales bacterium]
LQQRYVTLQGHWRRITRQIEEGRYKPHVQKAQRLLHSAPKPSARRVRQTDPAPPPATEVTAPTASETSPWQAIGERYLAARRRNGEITGNLNAATVARRIEAMLPKLRARHPDRAIDFEVTEHQGRVALRPVLIDLGE